MRHLQADPGTRARRPAAAHWKAGTLFLSTADKTHTHTDDTQLRVELLTFPVAKTALRTGDLDCSN